MSDPLAIELVEELDAFDPKWKDRYASIKAAATAAGLQDLYLRWAVTPEGKAYLDYFRDVSADYAQRNELSRRQIAAEHAMFVEAVTHDGIPEIRT